jgi:hypothetical protein
MAVDPVAMEIRSRFPPASRGKRCEQARKHLGRSLRPLARKLLPDGAAKDLGFAVDSRTPCCRLRPGPGIGHAVKHGAAT